MNFYEEIKNIEDIINCIEDENREYGIIPKYGVVPYELELPKLLRELIKLKSETNKDGYIVSEVHKPCTWCKTPTNIVEVCSEGHFCSSECEDAFMDYLMKVDKERNIDE